MSLTEGDVALRAARSLLGRALGQIIAKDLAEIAQALGREPLIRSLTLDRHEFQQILGHRFPLAVVPPMSMSRRLSFRFTLNRTPTREKKHI